MLICKEQTNELFHKASIYQELSSGNLFIYVKFHNGLMNLESGLLRINPNKADYIDVTKQYCLTKK